MTRLLLLLLLASCTPKAIPEVPRPSPVVVNPSPLPVPSPTPLVLSEKQGSISDKITSQIRPEWVARLDVVISGIIRDRQRYVVIQNLRSGGMLWYFVAGIHERESSRNFTCHLHEGSPLIHRTLFVPIGRLPDKEPPYTFEQSAEDALYVLEREDLVEWSNMDSSLYAIESYNGLGYRQYHPDVKSPYVYSGTNLYARGKYIADGRFSAITIDQQPGVYAIYLRMKERGLL